MIFNNDDRRNPRGIDIYKDIWHRPRSLSRFLGNVRASKLKMIDIDSCEFCPICRQPYALKETKRVNETQQFWHVTGALATKAKIPGYLVVYETHGDEIEKFEVHDNQGRKAVMEPEQYAKWLWSRLRKHLESGCAYRKKAEELLGWDT